MEPFGTIFVTYMIRQSLLGEGTRQGGREKIGGKQHQKWQACFFWASKQLESRLAGSFFTGKQLEQQVGMQFVQR